MKEEPEREEDPEKEMLKKELLGIYKGKVRMLEREVKMVHQEIRDHAPDLARKLEIE